MSCSAPAALLSLAILAAGPAALCAESGSAAVGAAASGVSGAANGATGGAASAAKEGSAWTIGIARFSNGGEEDSASILLDTLPRLIAAKLKSLPTRRVPEADAREIAKNAALRARFAAGSELASKLDARASSFFDYVPDDVAWKNAMTSADKEAQAAKKKLDALLEEQAKAAKAPPSPPAELAARLWADHASGKLIDAPKGSLSAAAKAAGVDLLVTGRVSFASGYAAVEVFGFDSALGREVFSWKSHCSIDDPEPLAADMASRIELWAAGRDMARLELRIKPASATLLVDGKEVTSSSRVVYAYESTSLSVSAEALGHESLSTTVELALGERKSIDLSLEPKSTGVVALSADPPEASISLDSSPLGRAPLSILLDGSRSFVTATAEGFEMKTLVLPASGSPEVKMSLLPSDGLGPSGRIEKAKDRFYTAFGFLMLTVPGISLSAQLYNDYYSAYKLSTSPAEALAAIETPGTNAYNAMAVSIGAACFTGAFTIYYLVKYLRAAL